MFFRNAKKKGGRKPEPPKDPKAPAAAPGSVPAQKKPSDPLPKDATKPADNRDSKAGKREDPQVKPGQPGTSAQGGTPGAVGSGQAVESDEKAKKKEKEKEKEKGKGEIDSSDSQFVPPEPPNPVEVALQNRYRCFEHFLPEICELFDQWDRATLTAVHMVPSNDDHDHPPSTAQPVRRGKGGKQDKGDKDKHEKDRHTKQSVAAAQAAAQAAAAAAAEAERHHEV